MRISLKKLFTHPVRGRGDFHTCFLHFEINLKMPTIENEKTETEEEEMERETPESDKSFDDESESGSMEEDGSGG